MKRVVVFMVLGAAALGYCAAPGGGAAKMPKAVVAVEKVSESEDFSSRRYTGQVVSRSVVQIVPRVSGEILEIGFQDGAAVRKGQLLYKLDSIRYEAEVKSAEAKIAECKAKLEYAQNNFERNNSLFEKKAASKDSMENTKSALEAYKANLLEAEAALITARDDLKNSTISAPIDGIAGVTNFTAGNYITASSGTLVTIIQVQPMRICFSISTGDFLSMFGSLEALRKNGFVRIRLSDGTTYPEEGEIELLNNEANRKTDAIQIYATFPNADRRLIVGSTVGVTLAKRKGVKLPTVAPSAVMHDNQGSYVYVVAAGNKIEKRYIVTGNVTGKAQMVISGLKVGEFVVVQGTHKTMPGAEIEPVAPQEV